MTKENALPKLFALTTKRMHSTEIRVMSIFNTYGPRMLPDDGRVISNFIVQALRGKAITIYGDGSQTRSFCYIDDLIERMIRLMNSDQSGPINIGNPEELTIREVADLVRDLIKPSPEVVNLPLPEDDPLQRKPVTDLAKHHLDWQPAVDLEQGLIATMTIQKHSC